MQGLYAVFKKELCDHFSSYRFVILFALIAMVSFITTYMAGIHLRENLEVLANTRFPFLMLFSATGALFSMVQFVAFFGPLIGIVLGFDSINRERAHGTLVKIISQPIYRDAVINGKFLAGVATITIMLLSIVLVISGFGLALVGVVPGIEEVWRLFITFPFGLGFPSCFPLLSKALPPPPWPQWHCGSFCPFSFPWEQMWSPMPLYL
jgi:ABC-2 type transport system permease protein